MMGIILLALGLVLLIEGLVYALAPSLVEAMLAALRQMTLPQRRVFGFGAMIAGVLLIWLAQASGLSL